jgi:hypothetical protein
MGAVAPFAQTALPSSARPPWIALAAVSALIAVAAGCSGGSAEDCNGSETGGIQVTVVDDATGRDVCDASVTASSNGRTGSLPVCTMVDASCTYCLGGGAPGTWTIHVTAPGYEAGTATVELSGDACGLVQDVVTTTVKLAH